MTNFINRAAKLATIRHSRQTRKDGSPYIYHPCRVAATVYALCNKDEELTAAAWLHDTIEDCGVSHSELATEFGSYVADLVQELTTDAVKCKEMGKAKYLAEKMQMMSSDALTVKLADRLDNVSDLDTANQKWAARYRSETAYILDAIEANRVCTNI